MRARSFATTAVRSGLPAALLFLGACQGEKAKPPAPPPASGAQASSAPAGTRVELSEEFTAAAEVTAIAREKRIVTLRREDGSLFDVQAGDGVRNFDQIAVGDALRVRYKAALAATKLAPGESARPMQGALAAGRAKEGAKPGAGVGAVISVRVRIESIDREHGIVVFSLASGELVAHRIQTPQGHQFVQGLSVGDAVQLDYGEVLALGVDKM